MREFWHHQKRRYNFSQKTIFRRKRTNKYIRMHKAVEKKAASDSLSSRVTPLREAHARTLQLLHDFLLACLQRRSGATLPTLCRVPLDGQRVHQRCSATAHQMLENLELLREARLKRRCDSTQEGVMSAW